MNNAGHSSKSKSIKGVFSNAFPGFEGLFEKLATQEIFYEMLTDYWACEQELENLNNMDNKKELYVQLRKELKQEIHKYIVNSMNVKNETQNDH